MELKEFIKTTLVEITQGVKEANQTLSKPGEKKPYRIIKGYEGYLKEIKGQNPGLIYFDVAVTASNESKTSGKAGAFIKIIEIGGFFQRIFRSERVSRIQFCVGVNEEIK